MKTSKPLSPFAGWSPKFKKFRALSLRQPWAWLVVNGYKDIENRSWRTNHRGPLLIHASANQSNCSEESLAEMEQKYRVKIPRELPFGGIIGIVDVVDCAKQHPSIWKFRGSWGWVLKSPHRLPYRKCKGFVGLFKPHFSKS
jgi:hypothetical protein